MTKHRVLSLSLSLFSPDFLSCHPVFLSLSLGSLPSICFFPLRDRPLSLTPDQRQTRAFPGFPGGEAGGPAGLPSGQGERRGVAPRPGGAEEYQRWEGHQIHGPGVTKLRHVPGTR